MTAHAGDTSVPVDAGWERLSALVEDAPDLSPLPSMQLRVIRSAADSHWAAGLPEKVIEDRGEAAPLLNNATIGLDRVRLRHLLDELAESLHTNAELASALRSAMDNGAMNPIELVYTAITYDDERVQQMAQRAGIEGEPVGVLAQLSALPVLLAYGRHVASTVATMPWSNGYCPVCGAWPTLAEMRGLNREYWLRCGRCASEWQYNAGSCVFCGEEDHERLGYLAAENERESRRAATCEECHGYVKTFASLGHLSVAEIAAHDLLSVELDVAALEAGYSRPSATGFRLNVRVEPLKTSFSWRGWIP
jgi:FdhE protein